MKNAISYVIRKIYLGEHYEVHYASGTTRFYTGANAPSTVLKFLNNAKHRKMISSATSEFM